MAKAQRKRYRNKTNSLQVVYDENGVKREVVPDGTVILDSKLGSKYVRVLEEVKSTSAKEVLNEEE